MIRKDNNKSSSVKKNSRPKTSKQINISSDESIIKHIMEKQNTNKSKNKPALKSDPLLLGYELSQITGQLGCYPNYVEIADKETKEDLKKIKSNLKGNEFKFAPILRDGHWYCGVIINAKKNICF